MAYIVLNRYSKNKECVQFHVLAFVRASILNEKNLLSVLVWALEISLSAHLNGF